jgi:hypothetical protein
MLKIVEDFGFSGVISIESEGHDMDPIEELRKTKALNKNAFPSYD